MRDEERLNELLAQHEVVEALHQRLLREHAAYMKDGEAFLREVRRGGKVRRLEALYRRLIVDRTSNLRRGQEKQIKALDKMLQDWKSPGQQYVEFVDSFRLLPDHYTRHLQQMTTATERVRTATEAFERFLQSAGR